MPRGGGGGFRGGGFRGGGFRGGGFRGGGFSGGFRGSVGGGGRPFGRTGATRISSRSPRGPYSHTYHRPHRRYYRPAWWYHRPWYWRWWYSPWWAGRWYRPWYYSPVYIVGGITFMIVLALIILPLAGVALLYPFSDANAEGMVTYRSTETLYFNEFWYEYEYIEEGNEISINRIQSNLVDINFAIDDRPFERIPTKTMYFREIDFISLDAEQYEYLWLFLRPGSLIEYDFNSSNSIDFFIADGYDLYSWDQGESPDFYVNKPNTNVETGSFSVTEANDYYVVWYNDEASTVDIDFTVDFSVASVVDFTTTNFYINETTYISEETFTVPNSGNWYFFIYFDPINSIEEYTTITFDVSYDTGKTSVNRWLDVQWIFIIVLVVVVIILIAALIARRSQKKLKLKTPTKTTPAKVSPYKTTTPKAEEKVSKCPRCEAPLKPDAKFCSKCGGKIEGRQIGQPTITTPAKSKTCSLCGSKLSEKEKFCKWCGTKVED